MKHLFIIILSIISIFSITSCIKELNNVEIIVEDQYRHYYPIIQGQQLEIVWKIGNLGDEPLIITDIIPSCGCIETTEEENIIIPPKKYLPLKFKYDSSKNSGYTSESIFIYGNINSKTDSNFVELIFDTNVIPIYGSSPDYEEYYANKSNLEYNIKGVINGYQNEKGYWIDDKDYHDNYKNVYKHYMWSELNKSE